MSKLDFPLHGSSLNIVTEFGAALSDIIDSKFGCVATFHGVDFEVGGSTAQWRKPTPIAPERRCEFILPAGVKVSVWKADLTSFPADAVVNAANEHLKHYGGLAYALSAAGGPQIQQESDDYIKKHGPLKTGDAVALGAGNLPYKKIIHAVGPDLLVHPSYDSVKKAKPLLEAAVRHIFDRAEDCHLTNVAIPAISSGLFHYPLPHCADTIVSVVKHVYKNPSPRRNLPKEVFFVNHDEPTVKEMERACREIFHPQQAVTHTQPVTHTQAGTYSQAVTYTQQETNSQAGAYSQTTSRNTRSSSKTLPPVQLQIGNVLLTLKQDKIEKQKTDVIVNTASQSRDLTIGQISAAILKEAGWDIQKDIKNAKMEGHIIGTKSHKLRCKEVYHTFCIDKWSDPAGAQQVLYISVLNCLLKAGASNHSSISFPAIGTGALGFSKAESAFFMLDAVVNFAQNWQNKLEVFFVIFPSDYETFQAFESEIRRRQQQPSHHSSTPAHDFQGLEGPTTPYHQSASHHSSTPAAAETSQPQISLCGPSDESTREAERWLSGLLINTPRPVKILNNFLLHFSYQDHLKLSLLSETGVQIEEFFSQGHACITIGGNTRENVALAALKVEEMLCETQKEFVSEEKGELQLLSDKKVSFERQPDVLSDSKFSQRKKAFKSQGLWVTKVDKVKNLALEVMFGLKKQQLGCSSTQRMFQRIPAQFCELIGRIGFHAECAPPEDPKYGEGIYFADTVEKAMELWKETHEEFLYFVEAEVLTGKSVRGKRGLIMPPFRQSPDTLYDSVTGGQMSGVSVIFSGYQALPRYIFICRGNVSVL